MWKNNASSVHSFPNINLNSAILPLRLDNLETLNVTASWSIAPTDEKKGVKLSSLHTAADVVIDMFLDTNIDNAASKTNAAFEVMVWIGSFGGRTPIGWDTTFIDPPTQNLSSTSL
jgi:xyloglucan-specific endo-beta-1,4-glucanase